MKNKYGYIPATEEVRAAALSFLRGEKMAVFATATTTGEPQAGLMYFLVDDNFVFYVFSAKNSQKVKNVEHNKHVALVVGLGPSPTTIQVGGEAEVVDDIDAKLFWKLVDKIKIDDIEEWPLSHLAKDGGFSAIRITPRWMSMLNLDKQRMPETYFHDFQKVIEQQ